jgi:hypothetical protein
MSEASNRVSPTMTRPETVSGWRNPEAHAKPKFSGRLFRGAKLVARALGREGVGAAYVSVFLLSPFLSLIAAPFTDEWLLGLALAFMVLVAVCAAKTETGRLTGSHPFAK